MDSVEQQPYRIGLVGAGETGLEMLRHIAASPDCELVGVADQSTEALRYVLHAFPNTEVTDETLKFVRTTTADAIVVTSPPSTHTVFAGEALNKARHVLVKSPLTNELRTANALSEFAQANGLILMVDHETLYRSEYVYVRELVDSGELGNILYVDSEVSTTGAGSESGVLWNMASDALAPILYWIDELPMNIEAVGRSYSNKSSDDATFITLHFASGIVSQLRLSWLAPVESRRVAITGGKSMAVIDDSAGETLRVYKRKLQDSAGRTALFGNVDTHGSDIEIPRLDHLDPLSSELEHFLYCIKYGQKPRSSARTGIWTVAIIEAAERALHSGRKERIDYPPVRTPGRVRQGRAIVEETRSV